MNIVLFYLLLNSVVHRRKTDRTVFDLKREPYGVHLPLSEDYLKTLAILFIGLMIDSARTSLWYILLFIIGGEYAVMERSMTWSIEYHRTYRATQEQILSAIVILVIAMSPSIPLLFLHFLVMGWIVLDHSTKTIENDDPPSD